MVAVLLKLVVRYPGYYRGFQQKNSAMYTNNMHNFRRKVVLFCHHFKHPLFFQAFNCVQNVPNPLSFPREAFVTGLLIQTAVKSKNLV